MSPRLILLLPVCLLAACGGEAPPAEAPAEDVAETVVVSGTDWSRCRVAGLALPVGARLFVIDGGEPVPGAEPGRESIRRVEVMVPGPVALLVTAPDATAWHVRPSQETEVRAVVALGDAPQRITGQRLGPHQRAASAAMGDACAGYLLADGAGESLDEATDEIFGKPHDAIYRLRVGSAVIGGTEPVSDRPVGQ